MFLKLLIVSVILVAFVMLALGVKMLFDKNAEFEMHSCSAGDKKNDSGEPDCSSCQLKEVADCS
ncbi:MAG: hypothetical protein R6V32_10455 [Bacteroidales bacterium]